MNSSQMMITMGAMILLSMVILRTNSSFLTTSDVLLTSKFNVIAISLASSIIEEAGSKAFDAASDSGAVSNLAQLTGYDALGPEGLEFRQVFNDFDDFDGFSMPDTFKVDSLLLGVFNINCSVDYVIPSQPDSPVNYQTWYKRLLVQISSPSMTDTIRMSTIYSYWYFR
ncbi:MAG: hypothetical protein JW995_11870 [Melioribacteraceae bacterium]|nr:hypothetical protein [Melioribacteraceae bacterium]